MSFLTPLFLLGAAGIALPVLFHLIRRTTREVTPFSSLMFLQPTPPRITQRSRLENLLLLILRACALALIAFGFARPFLPHAGEILGAGGTVKRTVILLDRSASMRRENLWPEAVARAKKHLHDLEDQDEVALLSFDREVLSTFDFEGWQRADRGTRTAAVLPGLQALAPTWGATALGPALLRAAEVLNAPAPQEHIQREIILISDLQEGSHVEGLQGFEWPKETTVTLERVEPKQRGNASAQWLADSEETDAAAESDALRVRVSNSAGATTEQLELRWAGAWRLFAPQAPAPAAVAVYVPAGQARTARVPLPPGGAADQLLLSGDETTFDNTLAIAPVKPQTLSIVFAGKEAPEDAKSALYFLERAFPKTRLQTVQVLAHPADQALPPWELTAAPLLVLGEGATDAVIQSARQFAESGKMVLAPLATAESALPIARLLNVAELPASEAPVKDFALLSQIDFRHPLFAPFADPRFSDFSKIHFWHYRRVGFGSLPEATVLARFESGDPAIVQVPVGKGAVIILTSSWRPADSQLALSSKFVPLLQALLDRSGGQAPPRAQYFVGEPIPIPNTQPAFRMQKPDGTTLDAAGGQPFTGTDQPGFYTLTPGPIVFPVNLDPAESRTTQLTDEQLTALGLPLQKAAAAPADAAAQAKNRAAAEDESHQKLWRWLLLGAVLFLLAETALAARREKVHTPSPA